MTISGHFLQLTIYLPIKNKNKKTQMTFFYRITIAFCVITFEPIKIYTCQAPQNERFNLSFVTNTHIVDKKLPEMFVKWPFILSNSFPIRV